MIFNPINSTEAENGGSVFCENCIDFQLYNSSFIGQKSLLLGGALYLSQDYSSYMSFYNALDTKPVFKGNRFESCNSYQGGAVLIQNMDNFLIEPDNIFIDNLVTLPTEETYAQILQEKNIDFDEQELDLMQAMLGKGPDIYFNCQKRAQACSLSINSSTFSNSSILTETNSTLSLQKPIYYTFQRPVLVGLPDSILDNIGINSEWLVMLETNVTATQMHTALFDKIEGQQVIDYQIGQTLFINKFALIDRYYKLQEKDVFTELQIYFIGESSGSIPFKIKYEGEFGERVSAHENNVFHMLAEDGVFDLTPFKMYGPPGGTY